VWYTNSAGSKYKAYGYEYTASGQVHRFVDYTNGKTTVYRYDSNDRLLGFNEYDTADSYHDFATNIYYNDKGQLQSVNYDLSFMNGSALDTREWYYSYFYETDGRLDETYISTYKTSGGESYTYDVFDRVTQKLTSVYLSDNSSARFTNRVDYTYTNYNNTYASNYVASYTSTVNDTSAITYTYSYDHAGNITRIVYSTGKEIRYVYDDIGQLIREDNGVYNNTYVYTYDNAGNITSRITYSLTAAGVTPTNPSITYNYGYTNSSWGDQMTSFYGRTITYDAMGNPLSYYNGATYTFSWTGRQMTGLVKSGDTYSFTYNDEGIRTSKTVNGVKTTYYLNGSQIAAEETNGNVTIYIYDSEGQPIGMQYHGSTYGEDVWDIFWYEKNLFGDIVAVYNEYGTKLIEYTYNAWGRWHSSQYNGGYSTAAHNNPFRYRGYYYDIDLELYCLGTRYYDMYTGRFISPDTSAVLTATPMSLTDKNLYAYCDNNPVMREDRGGTMWQIVTGLDPRVNLYGGIGTGGRFGSGSAYDSSAYNTYAIRSRVANSDAALGGYYYNGVSSAVNNYGAYTVPGAVTVTDGMSTKRHQNYITNSIIDLPKKGSALKADLYHKFPDIVDNYAGYATKFNIHNGTLYQISGSYRAVYGRFEWIVEDGYVTHRLFVKRGSINGIPSKP